jgi:hypothetical protein
MEALFRLAGNLLAAAGIAFLLAIILGVLAYIGAVLGTGALIFMLLKGGAGFLGIWNVDAIQTAVVVTSYLIPLILVGALAYSSGGFFNSIMPMGVVALITCGFFAWMFGSGYPQNLLGFLDADTIQRLVPRPEIIAPSAKTLPLTKTEPPSTEKELPTPCRREITAVRNLGNEVSSAEKVIDLDPPSNAPAFLDNRDHFLVTVDCNGYKTGKVFRMATVPTIGPLAIPAMLAHFTDE